MKKLSINDFFKNVFEGIQSLLSSLLNNVQKEWNKLSDEEKKQLTDATQISEIIKNGYKKGAQYVIDQVATLTGLSVPMAKDLIIKILNDKFATQYTNVQDCLNKLADKIEAGVTDNYWNSLFDALSKFAAGYLSNGKFNWQTLTLGLIEFAYRMFTKNK